VAISSVTIDEGCTVCALCEQICPDVFEMAEDTAKVKAGADFDANEDAVREAADSCPVNVIKIS